MSSTTLILDHVLDQLQRELAVDRRACYVLGAGEGAGMAAAYGIMRADVFAAVIAIGRRGSAGLSLS